MPVSNSITIEKFIDSLNVETPSKNKFFELSHIFPVNPLRNINPNFERGILLYSLIAKYKPKNVLEIGTAEGFSSLCMAWAMTEHNIDGTVFTIDPKPFDVPIERVNTWDENKKNEKILLSTKNMWNKFAKKEWIEKIHVLTGYSGEILEKNKKTLPKMEMGFIDGHHVYKAVNHDFHAFLEIASENFNIIFDDYIPNRKEDVTKMIDDEILPNFDVTLIRTNAIVQRDQNFDTKDELEMCFIQSSSLKKQLREIFPKYRSEQIINEYVNWEKRWKMRKKFNKKIPFLNKFRFNR